MTIVEESNKLARLLYSKKHYDTYGNKGGVYFDHKTYDDDEDIPYFIENGTRYKIWEVNISKSGKTLELLTYKDDVWMTYTITLSRHTDEELMAMHIDGVLRDMYYETSLSWEIGDYELDFLKDD